MVAKKSRKPLKKASKIKRGRVKKQKVKSANGKKKKSKSSLPKRKIKSKPKKKTKSKPKTQRSKKPTKRVAKSTKSDEMPLIKANVGNSTQLTLNESFRLGSDSRPKIRRRRFRKSTRRFEQTKFKMRTFFILNRFYHRA